MSMRNIILLSLLGATTTLQAATEFPNGLVPADVVGEFAGGTILSGLPDDFPALLLPPGLDLRLIGSMQRNEYSQQILLRSPLGREALNEALLAALTVQGWVDVSSSSLLGISGLLSLRLCHNQHGEMTLSGTPVSYGTRLQVSRNVYPPQFTRTPCSEQQAQMRANAARRSLYESLVPVLEVPEGTVATPPVGYFRDFSSSFSSNSVEIEREGSIQVPGTNATELFEHFAAQLLFAALTVLRGSGDNYGVTLTLRSPPVEGSGIGIVGVRPL